MSDETLLKTVVEEVLEADEAAPVSEGEARDARVRLFADEGYMTVELLIDAPENGGKEADRAMIDDLLKRKGVVHGILQGALEALATPLYEEKTVVAKGTPPQHGQNGVCTELVEREAKKQLIEREDGTMDYRNLGLIRDIKEGTPLCDITLPTKGENGQNTKGEKLKATDGVAASIPAGENTRVVNDGTRLEAAADGNLTYRDGRFNVEKTVRVNNIDFDTGNVKFSGDVIVNGDIMDGFEVEAGGNITLRGQTGVVTVRAGGDITIEKGLNGSGKTLLETPKTLKAGFVENCILNVGEKLQAQTLLDCQVECEGEVDVSSGKGIVCGGKLTVSGSVKVRTIGNDSSVLTTVALGVTPRLLRERKRMVEQLEEVQRHIDSLSQNVDYINRLVKDGRPVPDERVQMLKRSQIQLPLSEKKRDQLQEGINEIEERMKETKQCTLVANTIYPPTKISIGTRSTNIIEQRNNCRVYIDSEGELVVGKS